MWTRDVQNVVFAVLFCGWLGGMGTFGVGAEPGKLFTIEEVGNILNGNTTNVLQGSKSDIKQSP
jgi:hypothetical protein